MASPHQDPAELERIYGRRFDEHIAYRNSIWKVLTSKYFSRYIEAGSTVLDLGCGYGEFINNIEIRSGKKYAMDLNPRAGTFHSGNVDFLLQDCSKPWNLLDDRLDLVLLGFLGPPLRARRLEHARTAGGSMISTARIDRPLSSVHHGEYALLSRVSGLGLSALVHRLEGFCKHFLTIAHKAV